MVQNVFSEFKGLGFLRLTLQGLGFSVQAVG